MTPRKLFISYPSESWNFAQRIAESLAPRIAQAIFIDYRSIDQADFAASILGHLRESDGVLLVVTEYTFEDIHRDGDWVRLEIRTALEAGIPIVLVRENGLLLPRDLPDDVREVSRSQGIPFYREFFTPGIELLAEFLVRIGVASPRDAASAPVVIQPSAPPTPAPQPEPQRALGTAQALDEAADLLEAGDFEKASFLLTALDRAKVRAISLPILDDLLAHAEAQRAEFARRREAALDYEEIARWANRRLTEAKACDAFAAWCAAFPDLVAEMDALKLRDRFTPPPPPPNLTPVRQQQQAPPKLTVADILPAPFAWCPVPAGEFMCGEKEQPSNPPRKLTLPAFEIAKHPITWEQFQVFLDADDGFKRADWWQGLAADDAHRAQPGDQAFKLAGHPRERVSWYDAIAFCRWLSARLGGPFAIERPAEWAVRLPTEWEWEKAARGEKGLAYPYGASFDKSKSNTNESGIKRTTPVTAYPGGASPYGALDMSGNVWQWTLGPYETPPDLASGVELLSPARRVVRGGSWHSNQSFARAAYRNNSNPSGRSNDVGFRVLRLPS